ncbi:DUF2953 domain-containing protein [Paenibacillus turpanensis]|uniref:DUF2953 domain-containing protein n=1 Tax=Paenibacillus turpanensis TaxID=2689078 RepID=UPI0014082C34|nr:DUF2953 domain-containing protein [Paenibacillus turpanensis]
MLWWFLILFALIAVSALLLSMVSIRLVFRRMEEDDYASVEVKAAFGLVKYKVTVPTVKWKGTSVAVKTQTSTSMGEVGINMDMLEKVIARLRNLISHVEHFQDLIKKLLKVVHVKAFRWDTQIGLGDAVNTALSTGVIWGVKSGVLGYIHRRFLPLSERTVIQVSPVYNHKYFATELECRIQTRLVLMAYIGCLLIARITKTDGGLKVWWNELIKKPALT